MAAYGAFSLPAAAGIKDCSGGGRRSVLTIYDMMRLAGEISRDGGARVA